MKVTVTHQPPAPKSPYPVVVRNLKDPHVVALMVADGKGYRVGENGFEELSANMTPLSHWEPFTGSIRFG